MIISSPLSFICSKHN